MSNVVETEVTITQTPEVRVFTKEFTLTSMDRCDACSAQAYYHVTLQDGKGELLFCAHHYQKNKTALGLITSHIRDESAQLSR